MTEKLTTTNHTESSQSDLEHPVISGEHLSIARTFGAFLGEMLASLGTFVVAISSVFVLSRLTTYFAQDLTFSYLLHRVIDFSTVILSLIVSMAFLFRVISASYSREMKLETSLISEVQDADKKFHERFRREVRVLLSQE
jgi:cytochrome c biogenesis protein CcdA